MGYEFVNFEIFGLKISAWALLGVSSKAGEALVSSGGIVYLRFVSHNLEMVECLISDLVIPAPKERVIKEPSSTTSLNPSNTESRQGSIVVPEVLKCTMDSETLVL